ncbi:serine hydrolase domain-containing protein [Polaribacter uvawellassae]|uniref:serine hydrolase domain-containing protein n=1 Tax=Polaribacter uvawellassae TaxID=3133495 RepID=UPI00321B3091
MKKINLLIFGILFIISSCNTAQNPHQEKINAAKEVAEKFLKSEQIPGMSISVSQKGKMIWSEGFGFADVASKKKVNASTTQFRVASISKTLTALAMAKLVDDNKLDFDASLYTYVPDFPKKKYDFTVRQIGGHIAGIRHYNGNEFLLNKKMSIVEGLDIFKNDSLEFEPGTNYKYSTYGWNLLSVVVQNAAEEDYNEYMKKVVFSPLQMKNTSLGYSDKEMPNRTLFYVKENGEIKIGATVSNEFKAAGGGFVSTSEDLILFGNEILNPKTVSKTSIAELVKPQQTTAGKNTKYGIGVGVANVKNNTLRYSHSGGGMGATAYLLMYPEKELVISILTNLSSVNIRKIVGELEDVFIE